MRAEFTFSRLIDGLMAGGDAPAVMEVHGGHSTTISFRALAQRIQAIAAALLRDGAAPGDPIGLLAPNSAHWITARLGIAAAGGVAVALDDLSAAADVSAVVRSSGMQRILTVQRHAAALRGLEASARPQAIFLDDAVTGDHGQWLSALPLDEHVPLPGIDGNSLAMLVYTSGTTGNPKPFHLRNRQIEANVNAIAALGLIGPGDRLALPLPLHHVYPFLVGVLVPLAAGCCVVLPEAATGAKVVEALAIAHCTAMVGVPRLYEAMVTGIEAQAWAKGAVVGRVFQGLLGLSIFVRRHSEVRIGRHLFPALHKRLGGSLRLLVTAGAKLDGDVIWKLEGLGFLTLAGYGLAETASAFTGNVLGAQRIGSEGRPFGDGRIRVAKAEASDPDAPSASITPLQELGEPGEIQLKGSCVFDGYLDNPAANATAFTADGWFRTGDLGHLDGDGFIYVTGRLKEQIVLGGGKKVFPEELERLYGSCRGVIEIAVLERNGSLVALVVPDVQTLRADGAASVEDTIRVELASVAQALPSFERLSGFALVREPLPRTRLGKYQRFLLLQLYENARRGGVRQAVELTPEDRELLENPRAASAWAILQKRYASRNLSLDADPQIDLGIDSLEWLSLGLELEAALGIRLAEQDFTTVTDVRSLLHLVAMRPDAAGEGVSARLPENASRWLAPQNRFESALGRVVLGLVRSWSRWYLRVRVLGVERLPQPPYVLVVNHVSDLDPPVMATALPLAHLRHTYWSGDRRRLFATAFTRLLARALHIFPVDDRAPQATLAMACEVLSRGNSLVWFPESWRSPDGRLQRFLPGIGHMLAERPVAAVPALIRGTVEAMPRDRRWPRRGIVQIVISDPVAAETLRAEGEGETDPARITSALRRRMGELVGKSPVGRDSVA